MESPNWCALFIIKNYVYEIWLLKQALKYGLILKKHMLSLN